MNLANLHRKRRQGQIGVAAVEFAILLPLLIALLSAPLFIGRVLWHYTAAQKAAHDAARFLATISESEMRTPTLVAPALEFARTLALAEVAELNPGDYRPSVNVMCTPVCDGFSLPTTIRVIVRMEMYDPFFSTSFGGDYGLLIAADVQMSYIGTK